MTGWAYPRRGDLSPGGAGRHRVIVVPVVNTEPIPLPEHHPVRDGHPRHRLAGVLVVTIRQRDSTRPLRGVSGKVAGNVI